MNPLRWDVLLVGFVLALPVIVLTAFISPFRAERDMVRGLLPPGEFVEIFIDTRHLLVFGPDGRAAGTLPLAA